MWTTMQGLTPTDLVDLETFFIRMYITQEEEGLLDTI